MKKRSLSIVALLVWSATQCFGQSPNPINTNTTYGGIPQDGGVGQPGQWVPDPTNAARLYNTGFGTEALGWQFKVFNQTMYYNTAIGYRSLYNINGGPGPNGYSGNTAVGGTSLFNLTSGQQNCAFGLRSLYSSIGDGNNSAFGYQSMQFTKGGNNNCAMGTDALDYNIDGSNNVAIGTLAQQGNNTNYNKASDNTSLGYSSFFNPGSNSQYNIAVGENALYNIAGNTINNNIAMGYQAFYQPDNKSQYNIAIGDNALYDFNKKTVSDNICIGNKAFYQPGNNSQDNIAIGDQALYDISGNKVNDNIAIGFQTLENNRQDGLIAIGYQALNANTNGIENTAIGYQSLVLNQGGQNNTAIGYQSLDKNVKGSNNTADGYHALYSNTDIENTAMGSFALVNNTTGSRNSALGYNAGPPLANPSLTYATAIGANSEVVSNHTIILGSTTPGFPTPNIDNVGIGMSALVPGNRLEISWFSTPSPQPCSTTIPASTYTVATCGTTPTGYSGLRFRDLTDASFPYPYPTTNPGHGFLSLDDQGNVVYMSLPTTSGIGNCATPTTFPSGASNDGVIDLSTNTHNFWFGGQNATNPLVTDVVIGQSCVTPKAKLDVLQHSINYHQGSIGTYVENDDISFAFPGATLPIAIKGNAVNPGLSSTTAPSVAGWFESDCNSSTLANYAIVVPTPASGVGTGGIVSIGYGYPTATNQYVGQPGGIGYVLQAASIYTNAFFNASDKRFKTNVSPLKNALDKIDRLNSYYYYFDTVQFASRRFSSRKQVGFIAQQVDSVLPEVVNHNSDGFLAMDYSKMTVLLLAGEKELKAKTDSLSTMKQSVDSMRTALNSMQACINKLCTASVQTNGVNSTTNVTDVNLSSAAILYQNAPNPFGEGGTKINYFLPEGTMGASIVFYDSYGNKLKEVQLTQTGMGTVNVNASQLTNGVYTYSLLINGNIVDTKKMVFAK